MSTGWLWHEIYAWHDTGNGSPSGSLAGFELQPFPHAESPESKARLASLVEVSGMLANLERLQAVPATEEDLLRVHSQRHVDDMKAQSEQLRGGDMGDRSSPFGQGGYDIARWAAGGTITAVRAVLEGHVDNAYALVRPPGHHAEPDAGMGFCMFNNIAVAIEHARANLGIERVAVVDWDVHHGNGTESCFVTDPDVLTISLHQDDLFPTGRGRLEHHGEGRGVGACINVPLPAGSGDEAYQYAIGKVVEPALRRFRPDLVIVACGFDASNRDPLGRMMLTSGSYRTMTKRLMAVADEVCGGRLVINHEGGYSPVYVPFCGIAVIEALTGIDSGVRDPFEPVWAKLPDQAIKPQQAAVVDKAATFVDELPTP